MESLTRLQARRVALAAQGFTDRPHATPALRTLERPPGRGQVFVHGEASSVRAVRRHLATERDIDPGAMSASGYWKLKRTEEGWREDKAEWKRLADADLAGRP